MRAVVLALSVLPGCALENPPFQEPEVGLAFDFDALSAHLSPSAAIATADTSGPSRSSPGLQAWPLEGGGAAGILWRGVAFDDFYGTYVVAERGLFRASPGGAVRTERLGNSLVTSLGDELFVVDCPRVGLTDPADGFVVFAQTVDPDVDPATLCGGWLGRGAGEDRVLQLDLAAGMATVHELDRARRMDTVRVWGALPSLPGGATPLVAREPAVGELSLLLLVDGGLQFVDEAGAAIDVTGVSGALASVTAWVAADGTVRVATAEGLYALDAVTGAATLLDAVPPSPTGTDWSPGAWQGGASAEAGEPNPRAPELTVPTHMAVRYATDAGFEVFEPPLTPCCDPAACRALGETYLLGGIGGSGPPVVAYDLWSWVGDDSAFTHVGVARPATDPCAGE